LQLEKVVKRLVEQKIILDIDASLGAYLAKKGYDENYGARPLKRVIQTDLLDPLAMSLIEKKFKAGDTIHIGVSKNKVIMEK
jgi:ATP-dependent Clp protease ATP-binding subunit ClpB